MENVALLQTKLHHPRLPANLISRPQLIERLEQGLNQKLTLICAPAGYGKSTLVASWLKTCSRPATWLSLGKMDGGLYHFLTYVVAAIRTIFPDGCAQTLTLLQATQEPTTEYLTVTFINEIAALDKPFILILDDYHQINQEAIHQFISRLIDQLPAQMHLGIISREMLNLSISRLRVNQDILEIRVHDLRFSVAESSAFLAQFLSTPLSLPMVEMLTERTEGWIAGLSLAAISLRGHSDYQGFIESFHGTNRYIMEYLLDEVITRQPPAIQQFLLRTSILNHLCGPLCDAITGNNDPLGNGQAYLEWLQKANFLIVPLDEENHWYRYHALLQDLLRHKLMAETGPQEVAALHARAADWLVNNGLVEEALHHLLAAGDTLGAAQLVEHNRHVLLNRDDWRILDRWLGLLPAGLLQQRPGLLMARALIFLFTFNLRAILALVQAAERLLQEPSLSLSPAEVLLIGTEIDGLRGILEFWQGRAQSSFDHLHRAVPHIPPGHGNWQGLTTVYYCQAAYMTGQREIALQTVATALQNEVAPDRVLTVRLLAAQFYLFLLAGELPKSIQLLELSAKLCQQHNYTNMLAWTHYLWGTVHYLWNNLESAEFYLARAGEQCYNLHTRASIDNLALLALTYQVRQQPAQANKTIEMLRDFARHSENPAFVAIAESCQARLWLLQNNLKAATRWLQTADIDLDKGVMFLWHELPRLTYCRVLIAQDTTAARQEALEKLQEHLKIAEETHNIWQIIEILALQSLVYQAQGQGEAALDTLKRAVVLAQPGGFIRTFVDCGPPMAGLLRQLAGQGVAPDYIHQILAAFPDLQFTIDDEVPSGYLRLEEEKILNLKYPADTSSEIVDPLIEPLTGRELEIFELLVKRLSNQEIARSLNISVSTVKSHITHIYQKLGVTSRYEVVVKARSLNLLPSDNGKTP